MITPGPVVITVAFIGYLVAGTAGAIMASIGIFLPVYVFTIIPAPWFQRHRANPQLQAFAAGATAAASGAMGDARRFRDMQGARFHPLQSGPQARYAGAMALGMPVDTIF